MIALRRIDHVSLRTPDVAEASRRWSAQFGLTERAPGRLACDDEPFCLELVQGEPGVEHVAYELRRGCSLDDARAHFAAEGVAYEEHGDGVRVTDPEGNRVLVIPFSRPTTWTPIGSPSAKPIPTVT